MSQRLVYILQIVTQIYIILASPGTVCVFNLLDVRIVCEGVVVGEITNSSTVYPCYFK